MKKIVGVRYPNLILVISWKLYPGFIKNYNLWANCYIGSSTFLLFFFLFLITSSFILPFFCHAERKLEYETHISISIAYVFFGGDLRDWRGPQCTLLNAPRTYRTHPFNIPKSVATSDTNVPDDVFFVFGPLKIWSIFCDFR